MSLVETMIAIGIFSVIGLIGNKVLTRTNTAMISGARKTEFLQIKRRIISRLACKQTIGIGGSKCLENDGFLTMVYLNSSREEKPLTKPLVTSGDFKGAGRIYNWYVRATCKADGIEVSLAKKNKKTGGFSIDRQSKKKLDWGHVGSVIISNEDGLCKEIIELDEEEEVFSGIEISTDRIANQYESSRGDKYSIGSVRKSFSESIIALTVQFPMTSIRMKNSEAYFYLKVTDLTTEKLVVNRRLHRKLVYEREAAETMFSKTIFKAPNSGEYKFELLFELDQRGVNNVPSRYVKHGPFDLIFEQFEKNEEP